MLSKQILMSPGSVLDASVLPHGDTLIVTPA